MCSFHSIVFNIWFVHFYCFAVSSTDWLGAASWAVSMLSAPVVIALCRRKSTRLTAVVGGLVLALGILFTSFATLYHQVALSYGKCNNLFCIRYSQTHTHPFIAKSQFINCRYNNILGECISESESKRLCSPETNSIICIGIVSEIGKYSLIANIPIKCKC